MTIEQIIKAFLDGGITLGMLALFAYMIIKLPAMMRESIELATAPSTEAMRALTGHIERMQAELERLSVLVFIAHSDSAMALQAVGMKVPPGANEALRATGKRSAS